VTFTWPYPATRVSLAGTFNEWTPQIMKKNDKNVHYLEVRLASGECYDYKFVVDGKDWCYDVEKPFRRDCGGNVNNCITLESIVGHFSSYAHLNTKNSEDNIPRLPNNKTTQFQNNKTTQFPNNKHLQKQTRKT